MGGRRDVAGTGDLQTRLVEKRACMSAAVDANSDYSESSAGNERNSPFKLSVLERLAASNHLAFSA